MVNIFSSMAYMLDQCGDGNRLRNRGQEWRLREEREIQWATRPLSAPFLIRYSGNCDSHSQPGWTSGRPGLLGGLSCVLGESQFTNKRRICEESKLYSTSIVLKCNCSNFSFFVFFYPQKSVFCNIQARDWLHWAT